MEGILDSWERGGVDDKGKRKKKEKKEREKKSSDAVNVPSSVIQSDYARVSGYL